MNQQEMKLGSLWRNLTLYKVFSKEGCPWCVRAEFALKAFDKDFEVLKLGQDFTKEEFIEKFGAYDHITFPAILKDGMFIGGFDQLKVEMFS